MQNNSKHIMSLPINSCLWKQLITEKENQNLLDNFNNIYGENFPFKMASINSLKGDQNTFKIKIPVFNIEEHNRLREIYDIDNKIKLSNAFVSQSSSSIFVSLNQMPNYNLLHNPNAIGNYEAMFNIDNYNSSGEGRTEIEYFDDEENCSGTKNSSSCNESSNRDLNENNLVRKIV